MKTTNKIKAILFDMDGTLVDTEPVGPETMKNFLEKNRITINPEEWILFDKVWRRDGANITFEEFVANIFSKYLNISNVDNHLKEFFLDYEKNILTAKQLPGANDALQFLENKYILVLVTASTTSQAKIILKNNDWDNLFKLCISHDDFTKSKPDPESFLLASKRLNLLPENCIVIEDSKNGVIAGKNANMFVVGVRAGNKHQQNLSNADIVIETLSEIKQILKG